MGGSLGWGGDGGGKGSGCGNDHDIRDRITT